jgi:tripartite-type tricarboxylate transporter receptor subunit TctC
MQQTLRIMASWIALILFAARPIAAEAQNYPARPVHFVVAFAAGGFADTVARIIAQKLSERVGQPVVVENRGGAGGNIASRLVAAANPDGYTILVNTAAMSINASLYKDPGFDAVVDFVPIVITARAPEVFVVSAGNPAGTLQEFVREFRNKRLTYSTAGVGSSSHLAGDYLFRRLAGLDAAHVPYQGGAPALAAAIGAQVDAHTTTLPPALPFIAQGKLKALAVASRTRVAALPSVPTVAEAGFGELEAGSWVGFFAPAKTSTQIVARLNAEINAALAQPDVLERFARLSVEPATGSTAEFAAIFRREIENWSKIVKTTGITAN